MTKPSAVYMRCMYWLPNTTFSDMQACKGQESYALGGHPCKQDEGAPVVAEVRHLQASQSCYRAAVILIARIQSSTK